MAVAVKSVEQICREARLAARVLARTPTTVKDAALEAIASALEDRLDEILDANERDMQDGREAEIGDALLDRLKLDEGRVRAIAAATRQIAALADPVGEVIDGQRLANGLDVRKVRVPLGVVAVVYEARPNVTIDAAALCLKSGNAIVLRGSSTAAQSNLALARIAAEAAVGAGLPEGCVSLVQGGGHEELAELATQRESVDLIIPRGGESLKEALQAVATVPVIYAASGNCHVYVDQAADLEQALAIVLNAKLQRPGVCNAAETLLVHEAIADRFVPIAAEALSEAGVTLRADDQRARAGRSLGGGEGRAGRRARLVHRVPRPDARDRHRRIGRGGDRAHRALRQRPLGGDRDARRRRRARLPARRRRGMRVRQRLDALHRRRRVRDGRRDRQLDSEAPRARADRPARAVHVQVPRRGRRARPRLRGACPRSASSGAPSTRPTPATSRSRATPATSSGSSVSG